MRDLGRQGWRLAAVAAGLLLVTACAPSGEQDDDGADTGDAAEEPAGGDEISTDPGELGELTLTVWDQEVRGGQADQITELNEAFEEAYPNITVERVARSTDDLRDTLRLALTEDDAPDVVQANNGKTEMGQYVANGLLTPLADYAEAYGWADRFPDSVRAQASYTSDGTTLGEGELYGLPQMGELVGAFYNKTKLEALGLEPPETAEDFSAALTAAQEAGELPIQFGNLDPFAGIHEFGFVQNQFADAETIRDLGFGRVGSSWTAPENLAATEQLMAWVDSGYFTDGFAGVDYDPAWQAFAGGEGVFLVAGTWLVADLADAMGEEVGFLLPPAGASGEHLVTGGISIPFAVPSNSDAPEAAAAYIDFITSPEAMATVTGAGNLPVIGADEQEVTGLQAEVFDAWAQAGEEDLIVPYLDWATPTFFDTLSAAVQDVMAGQVSPEEFLDTLEGEYTEQTSG
jgi:raffinose/stachyose/melibiose transport system substrate-binding protein